MCEERTVYSYGKHNHFQVLAVGAFTLPELLVVIAVLGILASLLFPALNRAKTSASKAIDINNLKQIDAGIYMYVGENNDILPWPNWGPTSPRPGWLYKLEAASKGNARFDIENSLIWQSTRDRRLYFCPSDDTNSFLFRQRDQQLSSYTMNGAIIGYERTNFPPCHMNALRPDDIAIWEADETEPQYFNDGANYPTEGVSGRHLNGALNTTFDGSVKYIRLGAWYLQVYNTNKNSLWCYPGSINGR